MDELIFKTVTSETPEMIDVARSIFREYEAWLGLDLCFQGFEAELADLPGKYAEPDGRLILAYVGDQLAGCVALRKLEDGAAEMKRLYVKDGFRGMKIGVKLIEDVIASARGRGNSTLRLDTYPPKMGRAVELYHSFGFREIPPYYDNPHDDTLFMELKL